MLKYMRHILEGTRVKIAVQFPWASKSERREIQVTDDVAECLRALPADRELVWCHESAQLAVSMKLARENLIDALMPMIKQALQQMFSAHDPQQGYPPDGK